MAEHNFDLAFAIYWGSAVATICELAGGYHAASPPRRIAASPHRRFAAPPALSRFAIAAGNDITVAISSAKSRALTSPVPYTAITAR